MKSIPGLYVEGTKLVERPESRRTVFSDGTAESGFREGTDIELSHWIPNHTPARFKADTSTEICMNFVAAKNLDYDLVVNNHADVDGILSVFTLLRPATALSHRSAIVAAAGMGDFWGWGDTEAQVLFQSLTKQIDALTAAGADPQFIYERCLKHVDSVVERGFSDPDVEASLSPLKRSVDLIVQGAVTRREYHDRFVHYGLPAELCRGNIEAALRVPKFNAAISADVLLWPQARARWDREKVQVTSVETADGWYYDLWYPSYLWAETPDSWRAPGLDFKGDSNGCRLAYAPLIDAVRDFQATETNGTTWRIDSELSLFSSTLGRGFPVVLSAMQGERPAASSLKPELVAGRLAEVFRQG